MNSSTHVASSGIVYYSGEIIHADFETNDSFEIGLNGKAEYYLYDETTQSMQHYDGWASYWDRGGYGPKNHPTEMLLKPETGIVRSGTQSGRLDVLNTSESGRRFEILHDWDPYVEYLWDCGWFYFPSSIKPLDGMVCFQRAVYERMWDSDGSRPSPTQEFQISLSATTDGRGQTLGQQIFTLCLGKGWVDNDNDGQDDMWDYWGVNLYSNRDSSPMCPESWLTQKPGFQVPFDTWFKVETLVFRNITQQTDEYFNNGYVKVWIDDDLIWDVQGTRTVGIAPDIINEIGDVTPPVPQCFLSSGFGLYTAYGSSAKTIYVDDIILTDISDFGF